MLSSMVDLTAGGLHTRQHSGLVVLQVFVEQVSMGKMQAIGAKCSKDA